MFIDSHCHINSAEFDEDREDCIKRTESAGIELILDASGGVDNEILKKNAEICLKHKNVYTTVGVHPEEVENYADIKAEKIIELSKAPFIVGIGECGLDFYYGSDSKNLQIKVFLEHIKAAQITKLPLIIHSREADEDMINILAHEYEKEPFFGELHCFSSSRKLAEFALSIGFYISASGIITFKKSEGLRAIFADVPLDKLLIETDAPYLAPVPYRGKRNEPAYVVKTAEMLAQIKGVDLQSIENATTQNFYRLFTKVHT